MIEQALANEILEFLQRYVTFYKEFLQLESDKYNDLTVNNVSSLDNRVKTEEVFMLKSKGLELERDRLVERTGIKVATFRELIPLFGQPMQNQIQELHSELSGILLDLKEMNLRCNHLTELRLHRVEVEIKKLENRPELQKLYNARAQEGGASGGLLSKKI